MSVRRPQILIVDDEVAMVRSLEILLKVEGDVIKTYSVPEAEEVLKRKGRIDCIITDVSMPEASGLSLLDRIRRQSPEIPVIVMTAFSSVPQAVDALHRGAFEYIVKPFENSELLAVVAKAIAHRGLKIGETSILPSGWVCNSAAMRDFILQADKLTKNESPLLILGETGVGKKRAARWLHDQNLSSNKEPFFVMDARSHLEDLHPEKLPASGSIFVIELFSLPAKGQDLLARILESHSHRLFASSSSLPGLQTHIGFRRDLSDAFSSLTLRMPALRERKEDLEALSGEFLGNLARKMKFKKLELEASALKSLQNYAFPGNVRELERVLERAAVHARAGVITEDVLIYEKTDLKNLLPFSIPLEDGWNRLDLLRESLERELLLRALEKYPNNSNTEIAAILGTTRRVLELRMKAYQIRESS